MTARSATVAMMNGAKSFRITPLSFRRIDPTDPARVRCRRTEVGLQADFRPYRHAVVFGNPSPQRGGRPWQQPSSTESRRDFVTKLPFTMLLCQLDELGASRFSCLSRGGPSRFTNARSS